MCDALLLYLQKIVHCFHATNRHACIFALVTLSFTADTPTFCLPLFCRRCVDKVYFLRRVTRVLGPLQFPISRIVEWISSCLNATQIQLLVDRYYFGGFSNCMYSHLEGQVYVFV